MVLLFIFHFCSDWLEFEEGDMSTGSNKESPWLGILGVLLSLENCDEASLAQLSFP